MPEGCASGISEIRGQCPPTLLEDWRGLSPSLGQVFTFFKKSFEKQFNGGGKSEDSEHTSDNRGECNGIDNFYLVTSPESTFSNNLNIVGPPKLEEEVIFEDFEQLLLDLQSSPSCSPAKENSSELQFNLEMDTQSGENRNSVQTAYC
eukprot:1712115-Rhodomonas_salina.4